MSIYDDLGVRRIINAAAAQTKLGGSLMPPPVLSAMEDAASVFVSLPELHDRVGERLARLTNNESACVSCGAAAGILVAVAACMVGTDADRVIALPDLDGVARTEVIVQRNQRNGFLSAARETGARLVEVEPNVDALTAALSERTAAILWFAAAHLASGAVPLSEVVAVAHDAGVPVIVDAANQIPPVANLWHFTRDLGADLVIFSGGKGLCGPQASGLLVGRRDLIAGCRANSGPLHSIGRPAKVGKEEMVGLLAAVEWTLARDEPAVLAAYRATARQWVDGLTSIPGIEATLSDVSHVGQPIALAIVRFGPSSARTRDEVIEALWNGDPRIAVLPVGHAEISLSPEFLQAGDDKIVFSRLRSILG